MNGLRPPLTAPPVFAVGQSRGDSKECCRPSLSSEKGGFSLTEKEYKEHIQYTHNAYCRIVIRHASIDAARMLYAKWKREISLEYLSEEKFMPFGTTDEYFAQPPINEDYPFTACGQIVLLSDPALAAALSMLRERCRAPTLRRLLRKRVILFEFYLG